MTTDNKVEEKVAGFTMDELMLPYLEWQALATSVRSRLAPTVAQWLSAWGLHDLWHSPIDDVQRQSKRYGHYTGWFNSREADSLSRLKTTVNLYARVPDEKSEVATTTMKVAPAQLRILRLLSTGISQKSAAEELGISVKTVECQLRTMRKANNANNATHLVMMALKANLLKLD